MCKRWCMLKRLKGKSRNYDQTGFRQLASMINDLSYQCYAFKLTMDV